jgi:SAM-dependent methyltransferase
MQAASSWLRLQLLNDSHTFLPQDAPTSPADPSAGNAAEEGGAPPFILSPAAQPLLDELTSQPLDEADVLVRLTQLRRTLPAADAAALVTQARLRQRALAKFPDAARLFFTAEALEQSTTHTPAAHRAAQLDACAGAGGFLDLGCGIGGDLMALAQRRPVVAYELDPLRAHFATANAAALGLADRVTMHTADWTQALAAGTLPPAAAAFVDPARRSEGRRIFSLHAIQPPLAEILKLCRHVPLIAVKVMPGVDAAEVPAGWKVEFVSHAGACKEAVLWWGRADAPRRWASVHRTDGWRTLADDGARPPAGDLAPGMVLYEPDPAVIRAGALAPLCARVGGHLFAPDIAYIVAPVLCAEPLAQAFAIDEVHRFSLKLLNRRLAARGVGQIELLKRGFPQEPESLRPRLKLTPGGAAGVVIFTRRGDEHWMLIGRRLSSL